MAKESTDNQITAQIAYCVWCRREVYNDNHSLGCPNWKPSADAKEVHEAAKQGFNDASEKKEETK